MSSEFYFQCLQAEIDRARIYAAEEGGPFTERTPENCLIRDFNLTVLGITDAQVAVRFFESYVAYLVEERDCERAYALDVARSNVGWIYGEGMTDDQIRMWADATGARHPLLGRMDRRLSFDELIDKGQAFVAENAERRRREALLAEGIVTDDT